MQRLETIRDVAMERQVKEIGRRMKIYGKGKVMRMRNRIWFWNESQGWMES